MTNHDSEGGQTQGSPQEPGKREGASAVAISNEVLERFARSFEASARRWEFIVYPSLFAFILLAAYGFFLVYSLTRDMHTLATHVDPEMAQNMAVMADNVAVLSDKVAHMSDRVSEMTVSVGSITGAVNNLDSHVKLMAGDTEQISLKLDALDPMLSNMSAMNQSMAAMTLNMASMNQAMGAMTVNTGFMTRDMSQMGRPMGFMNYFMPW